MDGREGDEGGRKEKESKENAEEKAGDKMEGCYDGRKASARSSSLSYSSLCFRLLHCCINVI